LPVYTFRTNKGEEDVDEILSRIPVSSRGWFLKEAVRFHAGIGEELKKLNQGLERLGGGGLAVPEKQQKTNTDDMDDMLALGIEDLLVNGKDGRNGK